MINMNIKEVIKNLRLQLLNDITIRSLVKTNVYISEDLINLVETGKTPLINIEMDPFNVGPADNMGQDDYERRTVNLRIQFIVTNKVRSEILVGNNGLLDFYEKIYTCIKTDETLSGTVDKLIKTPSLITEIYPPVKENLLFVAGGEMGVSFSKDFYIK